jgi:hypothetical protein
MAFAQVQPTGMKICQGYDQRWYFKDQKGQVHGPFDTQRVALNRAMLFSGKVLVVRPKNLN